MQSWWQNIGLSPSRTTYFSYKSGKCYKHSSKPEAKKQSQCLVSRTLCQSEKVQIHWHFRIVHLNVQFLSPIGFLSVSFSVHLSSFAAHIQFCKKVQNELSTVLLPTDTANLLMTSSNFSFCFRL